MSNSRAPSMIDGVQYLRAIAALMVVAHHARDQLPLLANCSTVGTRGVDIDWRSAPAIF